MKHLLSLSFVFLFFNLSSAQSKWSVGIIGGADLSDVHYDRDGPLVIQNGDPYAVFDASLQLRYGINVSYLLTNKFTLKSGFRMNAQGNQSSINSGDLRWGNQHNGQGGFDPNVDPIWPFSFESLTVKDRMHFAEIPLHITFTMGQGKWQWYIEGGVSPNIYLSSTSVRREDNESSTRESHQYDFPGFNKITASVDLGFGIQRIINDRMLLHLQPMTRYFILPIISNETAFKHHFYNFGLELGCNYRL